MAISLSRPILPSGPAPCNAQVASHSWLALTIGYATAMDLLHQIGLAAGLAWGSGIRLYAALFAAGSLARLGWLELPPALQLLTHDAVLVASGVMLVVEFIADKVPWFDSIWDAVHTFIRIPAGALLAGAAFGTMDPTVIAVAAILGGSIASGSHATKAGGRALINLSPEPMSNWTASFAEDLAVPLGLLAAIRWPIVFLVLLAIFLVVALWLLPRLWGGLRRLTGRYSLRRPRAPEGAAGGHAVCQPERDPRS